MNIGIYETSGVESLAFLAGGGEMGKRIRCFDWNQHPLGPPRHWPQSLKIVVRLMLTSRFAMWIGWGPELYFFCNDAYLPTCGIKESWVLGAPAKTVWAEIWRDIGPRAESVVKTGNATWDESLLLFLERSGYTEETYHTFSYSPISDDSGAFGGMLCVVTEDTERVVGERRLAILRELANSVSSAKTEETLFEAVEGVLTLHSKDLAFALIYLFDHITANARLALAHGAKSGSQIAPETLQISAGKSTVWPVSEAQQALHVIVVDDLAVRFDTLPPGPWNKPPRQAVLVPIAQQGQSKPAGVLIAGISQCRPFDAEYKGFIELFAGQIAAALSNTRAYESERQRAEALAELDRTKTAFFSNVSHEFRTPLTLMLGPLDDLLSSAGLTPEKRESLNTIRRNGQRLLKLVNSLLDFSRLEAGRTHAAYESVELSAYTAELASVFRAAVEKSGMRLIIDCPRRSTIAYVDRDMWEKIVLNLMSNAFKFTLQGEIQVSVSESGGQALMTVRDTGIGIPPEELPHIFERFHRVKGARGRTMEGTGIGLALVSELVRLHAGSMKVESKVGVGTAFTVSIPLGNAHLPKEKVGSSSKLAATALVANPFVEEAMRWLPEASAARELEAQAPGLPILPQPREMGNQPVEKTTILVADDNADMRDYISRLIRERYHVIAVSDGQQALEAIYREKPDLVLTDVMMPSMDGFQLLKKLRDDPFTSTIPIMLLSARAGEESRIEGLAHGADDYMVKPFSARELMARIAGNLELSRVRRKAAERERELRRIAEEANRAKDEFLAVVSHELRTPLTAMFGWSRILSGSTDAAMLEKGLKVIGRNVEIQRQLIEDLLDVSRIITGKLRLKVQVMDLASVIFAAVDSVRNAADAKGISIKMNTAPITISGDPDRLQQVVWNLVNNAIKFTGNGGEVEISVTAAAKSVQIKVSDTGKGISADFLPYVFDRFRQDDASMTRKYGGLGLGLSIVKHIVELHGGEVIVSSAGENNGAQFTVTLPICGQWAAEEHVQSTEANPPAAPVAIRFDGLRALIVDDDPDSCDLLSVILASRGAHVTAASSAAEAFQALRKSKVDVLLSDIAMPGEDGLRLLERMRMDDSMKDIPAIAITAHAREDDRNKAFRAGFAMHVSKPIEPNQIAIAVAKIARWRN